MDSHCRSIILPFQDIGQSWTSPFQAKYLWRCCNLFSRFGLIVHFWLSSSAKKSVIIPSVTFLGPPNSIAVLRPWNWAVAAYILLWGGYHSVYQHSSVLVIVYFWKDWNTHTYMQRPLGDKGPCQKGRYGSVEREAGIKWKSTSSPWFWAHSVLNHISRIVLFVHRIVYSPHYSSSYMYFFGVPYISVVHTKGKGHSGSYCMMPFVGLIFHSFHGREGRHESFRLKSSYSRHVAR